MGFIAEFIYRTKTNTSPPECSYFGGQMGEKWVIICKYRS